MTAVPHIHSDADAVFYFFPALPSHNLPDKAHSPAPVRHLPGWSPTVRNILDFHNYGSWKSPGSLFPGLPAQRSLCHSGTDCYPWWCLRSLPLQTHKIFPPSDKFHCSKIPTGSGHEIPSETHHPWSAHGWNLRQTDVLTVLHIIFHLPLQTPKRHNPLTDHWSFFWQNPHTGDTPEIPHPQEQLRTLLLQ